MNDRWLVLAPEATNTGSPRMLLEVLRGMRDSNEGKWSCEILLDRGGPLVDAFTRLGPVGRLSHPWAEGPGLGAKIVRGMIDRPWLKPRRLRRRWQHWQAQGGGLIFNNTGTNGRLLAALPPEAGPVVTHVHELVCSLNRFNRPQDLATTLRRTDLFLAVSAAVADDLRNLGVAEGKLKIVPNFLAKLPPDPDVTAARAAVCGQLQLAPGTLLVTGCGYLDPLKGTDLFVEMARQLWGAVQEPVAFLWLGDEADRDFARQVRGRADDQVHFLGAVTNPALYFAASEIVVVASRAESFSLVALEAGALGRPVLAFADARGPADLLTPELLVTELNAAAMAKAVLRLLDDQALAGSLGAGLRRRIASKFLAEQGIGRLQAALAEVFHD